MRASSGRGDTVDVIAPLMVVLWISALIGTPRLAVQKHRSGGLWFLIAIPLGLIAMGILMVLPSVPDTKAGYDQQHALQGCPACGALIPRRAVVCQYCQRTLTSRR